MSAPETKPLIDHVERVVIEAHHVDDATGTHVHTVQITMDLPQRKIQIDHEYNRGNVVRPTDKLSSEHMEKYIHDMMDMEMHQMARMAHAGWEIPLAKAHQGAVDALVDVYLSMCKHCQQIQGCKHKKVHEATLEIQCKYIQDHGVTTMHAPKFVRPIPYMTFS